jgi:hypothetical protein
VLTRVTGEPTTNRNWPYKLRKLVRVKEIFKEHIHRDTKTRLSYKQNKAVRVLECIKLTEEISRFTFKSKR